MERYEEMNRMREHVIKEIDKNDDRMVSLDEFIESTKRASFEKDEGWEVCQGHWLLVGLRLTTTFAKFNTSLQNRERNGKYV